ncbi:hypothetical protein BH10PSE19_BH10PSE19_08170 [soil metagenome]
MKKIATTLLLSLLLVAGASFADETYKLQLTDTSHKGIRVRLHIENGPGAYEFVTSNTATFNYEGSKGGNIQKIVDEQKNSPIIKLEASANSTDWHVVQGCEGLPVNLQKFKTVHFQLNSADGAKSKDHPFTCLVTIY